MNRRSEPRFGRPALEQLEARDLPSFLFPGTAVSNLVQPLNALNQDLQTHKSDFLDAVDNTLKPLGGALPGGGVLSVSVGGPTFARAVGDFQAMLNDQHAIDHLVKMDLAFIGAAATSELTAGDPIDYIVLNFGSLLGINIPAQFTDLATAADNAVNDPTVQDDVAINWSYTIPATKIKYILGPINFQTTTPPF